MALTTYPLGLQVRASPSMYSTLLGACRLNLRLFVSSVGNTSLSLYEVKVTILLSWSILVRVEYLWSSHYFYLFDTLFSPKHREDTMTVVWGRVYIGL